MRSLVRTSATIGFIVALTLHGGATQAQAPANKVAVAASAVDDLQMWGSRIEAMVRSQELVVRRTYPDRRLPNHSHEVLTQYHDGVPVHGGELMVHRAGGVAVSILGSLYEGVNIGTTPTISPEEAAEIIESLAGIGTMPGLPTLTVYPIARDRFTLVYLATLSNGTSYVLDALDGHVRLRYSEIRNQAQTSTCHGGASDCAVGVGRGVLGDEKKISTTESGGAFETRDSLRPMETLTLDLRHDEAAFARLSGEIGAIPGVQPSDIARDTDNIWTEPSVVDAHAHAGWVNDYLFRAHGLDGVDGLNGTVFSLVNLPSGVADSNAFFSPPPSGPEGNGFMAYGEFSNGVPLTAIDVVGHEMTHALTFFRPGGNMVRYNGLGGPASSGCTPTATIPVIRDGQVLGTLPADFNFEGSGATFLCEEGQFIEAANVAGAVGEGFSDVVGTSVEFFLEDATQPDYEIGEDFDIGPIRSLENPRSITSCFSFIDGALVLDQSCPDHISQRAEFPLIVFPDETVFYWGGAAASDLGGEHLNSTIFSHVYYLAIEGGTNPTSGLAVQGVGPANRDQIEEIFVTALLDEIPSSPSWSDVAVALLQTAIIRFGPSDQATTAVFQALIAVGLLS